MKRVDVIYFKASGKFYTDETVEIEEGISGYHALRRVLPRLHRIEDMSMFVQDSGDGKEPYIVPHLYSPKDTGADNFLSSGSVTGRYGASGSWNSGSSSNPRIKGRRLVWKRRDRGE